MQLFNTIFIAFTTTLVFLMAGSALGQKNNPLGFTRDEIIAVNPAWDFIEFTPEMILVSPKSDIEEVYFFDTELNNICYAIGFIFPKRLKEQIIESSFKGSKMKYLKTEETPIRKECASYVPFPIAKHYELNNGNILKIFSSDMCGIANSDLSYIEIELAASKIESIKTHMTFTALLSLYDIQLEDSINGCYIVKTGKLQEGVYEASWVYKVSENLIYNLLVRGNSKGMWVGFYKYIDEKVTDEYYSFTYTTKVKTASGTYLNQATLRNGFKLLFTDSLIIKEVMTANGNKISIPPYKLD